MDMDAYDPQLREIAKAAAVLYPMSDPYTALRNGILRAIEKDAEYLEMGLSIAARQAAALNALHGGRGRGIRRRG